MNEVIWWVVAGVVGYFIGSINPATLIARARGIDIGHSGSGNPGATNAARVMGRKTGIVVLLVDVLKGFIPVIFFGWLFDPHVGDFAGFMAILGHMTSPFLGFRGGKGVATTLGVLLAMEPWWALIVIITFLIVFALLKRAGIASVAGACALIVTACIDHNDVETSIIACLVGALVVIRHQRNLRAAWVDWTSNTPSTPSQ